MYLYFWNDRSNSLQDWTDVVGAFLEGFNLLLDSFTADLSCFLREPKALWSRKTPEVGSSDPDRCRHVLLRKAVEEFGAGLVVRVCTGRE